MEKIAGEIANRIISGLLHGGSPMRQEEFAREFQVSQAVVREAFLRLEGQRLVVGKPRKGFQVMELTQSGEREVVMMRATLETLAIRNIRSRPSPKHLLKIEEILEEGDRVRDIIEWEGINRKFHTSLAYASGLARVAAAIAELTIVSSRYAISRARTRQWEPRSNQDHRRIFEALCLEHFDHAANLLDNHIRAVERIDRTFEPG